jgi:hypothetical protein
MRPLAPANFHDGSVIAVEGTGDRAHVEVSGASGRRYPVEFSSVVNLRAVRPEGTLLYALAELPGERGARCFSFTNWDETADAKLEVATHSLPPFADRGPSTAFACNTFWR